MSIEEQPKEYLYLVAFKATSMESRTEVIDWLQQRGAVHALSDVYLLRWQYRSAGDIQHDLERFREFDGALIVLGLNQSTDRAAKGLSEDAIAWIFENLGP